MRLLAGSAFLALVICSTAAGETMQIEATDLLRAVDDDSNGVISITEFERAASLLSLDEEFHGVAKCVQGGENANAYDFDGDGFFSRVEATCWLVANDGHLWTYLSDGERPDTNQIRTAPLKFWKHATEVSLLSYLDACTSTHGQGHDCRLPQSINDVNFRRSMQQNAQQYPPKLAEREPSDRVVRVGRKLADSIGLGVQSAPGRALILSYSEDGEKETERLVVNGSVQLSNVVSQKPATDPSERSTFVEDLYTMSFDVDQTRETEEDTISFAWGRTWHLIPGWTAAEDGRFGWNSSLGISYATDRHWDRDVYQASWKGLLSKQTWGRMGYPLADHGGLRFAWQPTLEAQVGKVADDGGNAMLAMQKAAGTYYRLIPKLEAQYWPRILDDRLQFFASAARVHDYSLDEGFGQYSADLQFRIAANMWLVASYTKGHSVITLDKVDRWLLGFGVAL